MFTLRRYNSSDLEIVEYLHVYSIQQAGAYLGRGPWDNDVYEIEEAYFNNQGEFLIGEWDGIKNGFREVGRDKYHDLEVILYEKQLEE